MMNNNIKTLQKLRQKEEIKYRLGFNFQAKARKYLEEAKRISFERQRVQEQVVR